MMVGLLQPSAGTALLGGHDVTNALHNVYNITGVCPQDDRLWETLTGKEHLEFYGRLKGLKAPALDAAVESSLRAVNLWSSSIGSKRPAQQLQQVRIISQRILVFRGLISPTAWHAALASWLPGAFVEHTSVLLLLWAKVVLLGSWPLRGESPVHLVEN
jgi:ABC-type Na+ transport system ATPase subunit NatA